MSSGALPGPDLLRAIPGVLKGGKRGYRSMYCGRVRAWRGGGLYEVPVRLPVERELGEIPFEFTLE